MGSLAGLPEDAFSTNSMRLREIRITFENATNLTTTQSISLDGFITLPLLEPITAAGKTVVDLETTLTVLYEPQIKTKEEEISRKMSRKTAYKKTAFSNQRIYLIFETPLSLHPITSAADPLIQETCQTEHKQAMNH